MEKKSNSPKMDPGCSTGFILPAVADISPQALNDLIAIGAGNTFYSTIKHTHSSSMWNILKPF